MNRLPKYCRLCASVDTCTVCRDDDRREKCPLLKAEGAKLTFRNCEGYSDPTAFYALCNTERDKRKARWEQRQKEQLKKRPIRPRTQVVHYD